MLMPQFILIVLSKINRELDKRNDILKINYGKTVVRFWKGHQELTETPGTIYFFGLHPSVSQFVNNLREKKSVGL
jgi:hypothetical protein